MNWAVDPDSGSVSGVDPDVRCGFELGDWFSFASLDSGGLNATRTLCSSEREDTIYRAKHHVSLRSGSGVLTQTEDFRDGGIDRTLKLRPTSVIDLGDLVLRFEFNAGTFPIAEIANRTFEHHGRNRYLQFDTTRVRLCGPTRDISINADALSLPDGMNLVIYVRDEPPDRWIVHVRALAHGSDRGFVRFYDLPWTHLPFVDRLVRCLRMTGPLRYCRERGTAIRFLPDAIPFQYVESVNVKADDQVAIHAECSIEPGCERTKG